MDNQNADKAIATMALTSQKHVSAGYNLAAGECANNQIRCAMMDILKEEHEIQNDIFVDMHARGWYPQKPAQQTAVDELKQALNAQN